MLRSNYLRVVLAVVGLSVALYGSIPAQEKEKPDFGADSAKARQVAAIKHVYGGAWKRFVIHPQPDQPFIADYFRDWSVRLMQAERDMSNKKADKILALERHVKRMEELKERIELFIAEGITGYEVWEAEFFRLEAEEWLAAAKAGGK